ncbi:unnamed protein product [Dicrocoelium dendriticum]|nr:unnamed protein product [Dicrocoelium dendriticum]
MSFRRIGCVLCTLTVLNWFWSRATLHVSMEANSLKSDQPLNQSEDVIHSRRKPRQAPLNLDMTTSQCRLGGVDVQCLPPFRNIAQGNFIQASSTCGLTKVQRLCRSDGTCQVCDVNSNKLHFSANRLIDQHFAHNQTCWASSYVRAGKTEHAVNLTLSLGKRFEVHYIALQPCSMGTLPDSIAIYKSSDFGRTWRPWHYFSTDCYRAFGLPTTPEHNTHITSANLQEVLCVALQPQDSYLTRQLRRRRSMNAIHTMYQHHKVDMPFSLVEPPPDSTIAFSTTLGRPASRPWSPALIDWMSMTDIRISLMRFAPVQTENIADHRARRTVQPLHNVQATRHGQSSRRWMPDSHRDPRRASRRQRESQRTEFRPRKFMQSGNRISRALSVDFTDLTLPPLYHQNLTNRSMLLTSELIAPHISTQSKSPVFTVEPDVLSESEFYAFADLTIGGRCKCNGHGSECITDSSGQLKCVCEHNTDGPDCERCKPGFMDRPWERATSSKASACAPCDCNLHSSECRFSNALYLTSNRVSGGVCENCQHNTAGRNCQHCAEGYYRDWTKPISHEHACIPCRCHPIGSIIQHDCDRRNGQCRCKQGVTGMTCDRCREGFHQTRSPTNPCVKDFTPQTLALAHTTDVHCAACDANKERIKLKKFCRKDAVFQAYFKSRELHGAMARFEMLVTQVWRLNEVALKGTHAIYWPASIAYDSPGATQVEYSEVADQATDEQLVPVWVRLNELRCRCPEMELGITYLVVSDFESYFHNDKWELLFTSKTALLPWRSIWKRRLIRFKRRQMRGACDRLKETAKLHSNTQPTRQSHRYSDFRFWHADPVSQAHQPRPVPARSAYHPDHAVRNRYWEYVT